MSHIDQLQQRISFFENSNDAKDKIARSENDRLQLEIELNKLLNSDKAIAKNKAIKLKTYYTKLCDDEDKSLKRNQHLLSELHRIDTQFAQLESKLERLTNLKKECEVYLRTAYPVWTSENKILNSKELNLSINTNINQNFLTNASNSPQISPSKENYNTTKVLPSPKSQMSAIGSLVASLNINKNNNFQNEFKETENMLDKVNFSTNQENGTTKNFFGPSHNEIQKTINKTETLFEKKETIIKEDKESNEYIKKLIFSTGMVGTNTNTQNMNKNDEILDTMTTNFNNENNLLKEYELEIKRQDANMIDTLARTSSSINNLIQSSIDLNTENIQGNLNSNNNMKNNQLQFNTWTTPIENMEPPKASSTSKGEINLQNQFQEVDDDASEFSRKERNSRPYRSLRQELNLTSLYYIFDYIELEIRHTIHPERYYRQVEPHYKTKHEIIKLARENKSLDDMDPADISMVILDQLPVVVRKHTKNKCLFTSDLMGLSVTDINEQVVLKYLRDDSDKKFWTRLMKHFNFLKKFAAIDSNNIANTFAPLLLGSNQIGSEKAIKFLIKILNSNGAETFNESKSMTETSLNQELVVASTSKLKESNVYQDFINNSQNSSKSKYQFKDNDDNDDDDENDEIDALVAPKSLVSTNSSANNNNKPKNTTVINHIIKSPRAATGDFDFDFSQSSESHKVASSIKQLNSLRSSADKKQLPVYLRDPDSDDDWESVTEASNKLKSKSQKSDSDFEFYN